MKYELGTPFRRLYIIDTKKEYDGDWGKNGYNKLKLIAVDHEGRLLDINDEGNIDVVMFGPGVRIHSIDIEHNVGYQRLTFASDVCVKDNMDAIIVEVIDSDNDDVNIEECEQFADYISGLENEGEE